MTMATPVGTNRLTAVTSTGDQIDAVDTSDGQDNEAAIKALPTTAWLVLGLLVVHDEELSAVEIKVRAHFSVGQFYWSPAVSHIRRELNRLRELGLVREREFKTGRVRTSLLYQATQRGDEELQRWAESLAEAEPVVIKHPVLLKVWLARSADPLKVVEILDRHIAATHGRLDDFLWGQRRGLEEGLEDDPRYRYPKAVAGYVLRSFYAEIANATQLRDEISRGTAADPAAKVKRKKGTVRRRS
jgi:DNA-binding PadR family transcriptional regulator